MVCQYLNKLISATIVYVHVLHEQKYMPLRKIAMSFVRPFTKFRSVEPASNESMESGHYPMWLKSKEEANMLCVNKMENANKFIFHK